MGWFNFKKKEKTSREMSLPELPRINPTEHQRYEDSRNFQSLPSSNYGERYSQDRIKEAIGKEDFEQRRFNEVYASERGSRVIEKDRSTSRAKGGKQDPVFIRVDKYKESLEIFEKTREKIIEIEDLLKRNKQIKEEEEQQIGEWEAQIEEIKEQIQKIDKEMFSKVE